MPPITSSMKLGEKLTLTISVLSFIVAFFSLALSESVSSLYSDAKIVATKETSNLKSLVGQEGYIGIINIFNRGLSASEKIKIVISFDSAPPKHEIVSDEDISKEETNGNDIKIVLDRLSKGAKVKVTMYSKIPLSYSVQYIDNKGKGPIEMDSPTKQENFKEIFLLFVTVISLLVIFYTLRKSSENSILESLNSHQTELQKNLSDLRDEIEGIEISINEPSNNNTPIIEEASKGITQRLADFMLKT